MINLNNTNVSFKSRMLASELGKSGSDEVVSYVTTKRDQNTVYNVYNPVLTRPYQQDDQVVITYASDGKVYTEYIDANTELKVECLDGQEGREKRVYA